MPHRPQILALAGALALAGVTAPLVGPRAAASDRVIVVQPGQTLSEIAAHAGVTIQQLVRLNHLADPNRIFAGQRLRLPAARGERAGGNRAAAGGSRRAPTEHRVAYGDTLLGIALRYRTTVAAIARTNAIGDVSFIWVGQLLRIPSGEERDDRRRGGRDRHARTWAKHRVSYGETLSAIALRYGSTTTAIARANGITNIGFIRAGQVLRVPGAARPSAERRAQGGRGRAGAPTRAMPPDMAAVVLARQQIGRLIVSEARRQGVPVAFALAVAWQESGWQARVASYAGAIGVMQLLPATGAWVGSTMLGRSVDLWNPAQNVKAGVRLLRHYLDRYGWNRALALAAYYQGQAAADRYGVFPVSGPYIASILRLQQLFAG